MKRGRIASLALALFFALSFVLDSFGSDVYASSLGNAKGAVAPAGAGQYYYGQLPDEAKGFYDAMYNMYTQGIFKTGTGDYDLVANGHVTQEQLSGYASGNMTLLSYMGAARDAFYADYPEIFYVDFSYLSLRVTQKGSTYCAYLGPGRSDNYFVKGFASQGEVEAAIAEYEARVASIVDGANNLTVEEGKDLEEQKIKYAHDEIIFNTSYRMEDTCTKENIGHIRTAYGALIKGESLCEGYARAVKSVLDKLGIPCILVQGGFQRTTDRIEPHMWNYVQTGGAWYGLDATMDDPIPPIQEPGDVDGFERSDYLLVGNDVMGKRHVPDGVMSEANFEFTYPELPGESKMFKEVANENGLKVVFSEDAIEDGVPTGVYKVSYQGMGAAKSIENGKYLLMKTTKFYENTNRWEHGPWGYLLPDVYMFPDTETEATIKLASAEYVEFAVTNEDPGDYKENSIEGLKRLTFRGDPLLFEAHTEVLYNPNGTYVAPPYVKKATPALTSKIPIQKTHVTVEFYDSLKLVEGMEAGIEYSVNIENTSAMEYSKVENFNWDGDKTVTFDFTPSSMWLDESVTYTFCVTGLVGVESEKVPKTFSYTASAKKAVCAYRSSGYFWNIYGRPQLLEKSDLSKKNFQDWKTEDNSPVTPEMMTGLTLVATSPTHAQTDVMDNMVKEELGDQALKSETYNINMLICRQSLITVGSSIRISVGFPPGYGPDDEGVTFKAYHFARDKNGEIIGMEEIPCTITRYGLVILCKSFSPFAIVAAKDDGTAAKAPKSIILSDTLGGSISGGEDGMLTLAPGESKELAIQAEDGYVIDSVVVGGKYQKVTNSKTMAVKADEKSLMNGDVIEAQFVAESVKQKEEARGETVVQPAPELEVKLKKNAISIKEKEGLTIESEVKVSQGELTYQWKKDGVALPGKTSDKLTIPSASIKDAGKYTLAVSAVSGIASVDKESGVCNVTVAAGQAPSVTPEQPQTSLKKVSGLKASSDKTNRVKLQWNKVPNADGYQVLRYNASKKKFVKVANVAKTSFIDKKRTAGKPYRYKVKAYKKVNGKFSYGSLSKEAKVIVMPKTPTGVTIKRLSKTSVQISFKTVKEANMYYIYKYKYQSNSGKIASTYRVKNNKFYRYNTQAKKWVYLNKVSVKNGRMTCKVTGLNEGDKDQKYGVKSAVSKSGYKLQYSAISKKVTVK